MRFWHGLCSIILPVNGGYQRWSGFASLIAIGVVLLFSAATAEAKSKNVAVGSGHICAFTKMGKLQCWGDNTYGQLGNGKLGPSVNPYPQDVQFSPGEFPTSVAAGGYSTCSILSTGIVKCWGNNYFGQSIVTPTAIAYVSDASAVVLGENHACAITGGMLKCWGKNKFGQLGDGTLSDSKSPVVVKILNNVIDVAVGRDYTCALIKGGNVKCWGNNEYGQLGNNSTVNSVIPVTALLTKPAISIMSGGHYTCAIVDYLKVQCWGWNGWYQQGPKIKSGSNLSPITIVGLNIISGVDELALGFGHTCALGYAGSWVNTSVLCWGATQYGRLGAVSAKSFIEYPTKVAVPNPVTSIVAGSNMTCAIILDQSSATSSLQCWGVADHGELGWDPKDGGLMSSIISYPGGAQKIYYTGTPITIPNVLVGAPAKAPNIVPTCPSGQKWDVPGQKCVSTTTSFPRWYEPRQRQALTSSQQVPTRAQLTRQPLWQTIDRYYKAGGTSGSRTGSGESAQKNTMSATKTYWIANKPKVDALMTKLAAASNAVITTRKTLQNEVNATLEPLIMILLKVKLTQTPPALPVVNGMAAYTAAEKELQSTTKQLIDILIAGMKQDKDYPITVEIQETLAEMSMAFMNALFTASVELPLSDATKDGCNWSIVNNQTIYALGQKSTGSQNALGPFINTINNCLPQQSVNMLDEALTTAWIKTIAVVKKFHSAYTDAIRDYQFGRLSPIFINLFERTRFQGPHVPSRTFMQQYAERMKTLKPNTPISGETLVKIIPDALMLYDPASKKAEETNFCTISQMSSPDMVWNVVWKCMFYPNFIKNLVDPAMENGGACPLWDTARLGKPCLPPPPKTSWLDSFQETAKTFTSLLGSFFVSTAYASCDCKAYEAMAATAKKGMANPLYTCQGTTDNIYSSCGALLCSGVTAPSTEYKQFQLQCKAVGVCQAEVYLENCRTDGSLFGPKAACGTCGDGIVQPAQNEECDDGKDNGKYCCSKSCERELPTCGNGILDGKKDKQGKLCEKCDDKNTEDEDGCSHSCEKEPCFKWKCGNSVTDGPWEECDDGNNEDGDGCSNFCRNEKPSLCGNKIVEEGEECDDGNEINDDDCSNNCMKKKKNCYEKCLDDIKTGKLQVNSSCNIYFDYLEKSKSTECIVKWSPWEGKECPYTPYKIGDPCWKALQTSLRFCQKDQAVIQCVQDCKNDKAYLPSEYQEECLKNPPLIKSTWKDDFSKDNQKIVLALLNSVFQMLGVPTDPQLKDMWLTKADALYVSRIDDLLTVFENVVDYTLTPDEKAEAKLYGRGVLAAARPCSGNYELGKVGSDYAAYIDQAFICWNPKTFNKSTPEIEATQVLAHEGGHAMLFKAWGFAKRAGFETKEWKSKEEVLGCGMADYTAWTLDHWLMDYMYTLGVVKEEKQLWDYEPESGVLSDKTVLCEAFLLIKY